MQSKNTFTNNSVELNSPGSLVILVRIEVVDKLANKIINMSAVVYPMAV